jgi:hypothetical protein
VGDVEGLGVGEKYMLEMMKLPTAAQRLDCILYKQHFKSRLIELNVLISKIENACDDVKMSLKLKKVLKTILKVGNQMNDGENHAGFTVDSLLKLQSAKAFDKKTSILQYVVRLIQRNDEACLSFPEDLAHLTDGDRMSMSQISAELTALEQSQGQSELVVESMRQKTGEQSVASMTTFLKKVSLRLTCRTVHITTTQHTMQAQISIEEAASSVERMTEKFQGVLAYFGEGPDTLSQEFFSTLEKFVSVSILLCQVKKHYAYPYYIYNVIQCHD